jgi:hypothetical protein
VSGLKLYRTCILRNLNEDMYKEHGPDNALENAFQWTSYLNRIGEISIKKATETSREPSTFYELCLGMHQYSETNVMHFLFSLLRIKGVCMFRTLLAHPQEALNKRHLVPLQSWCSQLT